MDQSRTTLNLPIKDSVANTNDRILFLYSPNSVYAQTASITLTNLLTNTPNLNIAVSNLILNISNTAISNSHSLTIPQGTLFFSNNYGYIATSNNLVKRFSLTEF